MFVRRISALVLALALCLGLMAPANAETEYPSRPQGAVADLANVLGEAAIGDLETLSQRLEEVTGGRLFVLTRHFLGGMDAQTYADRVFQVWALEPADALVLAVIGEESKAVSLGAAARSVLYKDVMTSLLADHFNVPFAARQYDEAVADLCVAMGQALAKAEGSSLDVSGLFGRAAVASTPQPQSASDWWYGMFAREDYDAREEDDDAFWQDWQNEWHYEESTINWRGILIWGLVIYFLFFRRKKLKGRR